LLLNLYFVVAVSAAANEVIRRRGRSVSVFYIVLVSLIATFAGETITSLFTGAPPEWLTDDTKVVTALLVIVLNLCGFYVVWIPSLFHYFFDCLIILSSTMSLFAGYKLGNDKFHTFTAAILFATIRASGRSTVLELEKLFWGDTPSKLHYFHGFRIYLAMGAVYAWLHYNKVSDAFAFLYIVAFLQLWNTVRYLWGPINLWGLPESILGVFLPEGEHGVVTQHLKSRESSHQHQHQHQHHDDDEHKSGPGKQKQDNKPAGNKPQTAAQKRNNAAAAKNKTKNDCCKAKHMT